MSRYGFVKYPRDIPRAIPNPRKPKEYAVAELPKTDFAKYVLDYASRKLDPKVLNHSLRVYLYIDAVLKDHFPETKLDAEVVFVTCLLHDIGVTDENLAATKMSFEFYGGLLARDLVLEGTKNKEYADAVAEAIIRHQDLGETGYITELGVVLQIATILDNVGLHTQYVHENTVDAINKKYNRDGWIGCFAEAIEKENTHKPWGHTSALGPEFKLDVLANKHTYEKL